MNTQELFNRVVNHLLIQGKGAPDKFIDRKGCRCAKAVLMSNTLHYNHLDLFLKSSKSLIESNINRKLTTREWCLLNELESIYIKFEPDLWPKMFKYLASAYDLKYKPYIKTNLKLSVKGGKRLPMVRIALSSKQQS